MRWSSSSDSPLGDGTDDTRPYAYLNYIVLDANYARVSSGWQRVTEAAEFFPGEEGLPNMHEKVKLSAPVVIGATGKYIYVWVSNESQGARVWFDDVTVTHTTSYVSQATDYGVWGDVLREQKSPYESKYRFGYQGQFAEKDEETGWNHFELREYDPIVGRWLVPDPKKQYSSPYLSMGNNPLARIDVDGGFSDPINSVYISIGATLIAQTPSGVGVSIQGRFLWTYDVKSKSVYLHFETHIGQGFGNYGGVEVGVGVSRNSIKDVNTEFSGPIINSILEGFTTKDMGDIFSKKGISASKGATFAASMLEGASISADIDFSRLIDSFQELSKGNEVTPDQIMEFTNQVFRSVRGGEVNWSAFGYGAGIDLPALFSITTEPIFLFNVSELIKSNGKSPGKE